MLRTAGAASNASQALQEAAAATGERLAAECFLLPGLRPGEVFEVQSLPDEFSGGPWLVTRVTHRLDPACRGIAAHIAARFSRYNSEGPAARSSPGA
jgi:hypothetical protein